jgi:Mrp family chromosome partitioning ATPase
MNETTTDAAAILAPLWKRKWLILAVAILVGLGTYFYYKHKPSVYGASTEVYLGGNAEVASILGAGSSASSTAELANQAELINSNVVGEAVERQLRKSHQLSVAQGSAVATAAGESDFITFTTESSSPQGAAILANTYAQVYLHERSAKYRHQVEALIASAHRQLKAAEASGGHTAVRSLQSQQLIERINELKSQLDVGTEGDRQINPAVANPAALSPKPTRNAIFGFLLGLLLAAVAAYAVSRFDRRLRAIGAIEEVFTSPVLTAVPSAGKPIRRGRDGAPMPVEALREPLRRLHTTLQLQDLFKHDVHTAPRTLLFISAESGAGKSTLIAGLALVAREAGERVVVIDADMRRPAQSRLLAVESTQGLAEVLSGSLPVGEVLQRVDAGAEPAPQTDADNGLARSAQGLGVATAVRARHAGSVSVLASGGHVANPPALLAGRAMSELVGSLSGEFDYVLIDAPPPLQVSDVMPLLHVVDAILIVARVGHTRRSAAVRLLQLLERSATAPVLGVVANDVKSGEIESYGLSSAYYEKR